MDLKYHFNPLKLVAKNYQPGAEILVSASTHTYALPVPPFMETSYEINIFWEKRECTTKHTFISAKLQIVHLYVIVIKETSTSIIIYLLDYMRK